MVTPEVILWLLLSRSLPRSQQLLDDHFGCDEHRVFLTASGRLVFAEDASDEQGVVVG